MRPDDTRPITPNIPTRDNSTSRVPDRAPTNQSGQQQASNIIKNQIDDIYSQDPYHNIVTATEVDNEHQVDAEQWKHYHSSWQDYYQKYYERYYVGQVYKARVVLEEHIRLASKSKELVDTKNDAPKEDPNIIDKDQALYELRSKLIGSVQKSAKKAKKSRHFIPITAALLVMLVFLVLQYNRVIFANVQAYVSPGNIDPQNIIVDPAASVSVNADPKLIIPKINVNTPVVYDTLPDDKSQQKAMENGVAWFGIPGANSRPGQIGNTVISGHSSNDFIDGGNYKFVFALLEKLAPGDTIYLHYESKRYTYTVSGTEVVKPTEVSKLIYPTDKPVLTLITCTPLGTSQDRLLVTAVQISPTPSTADPAPTINSSQPLDNSIPGGSPTFLERIFGTNN